MNRSQYKYTLDDFWTCLAKLEVAIETKSLSNSVLLRLKEARKRLTEIEVWGHGDNCFLYNGYHPAIFVSEMIYCCELGDTKHIEWTKCSRCGMKCSYSIGESNAKMPVCCINYPAWTTQAQSTRKVTRATHDSVGIAIECIKFSNNDVYRIKEETKFLNDIVLVVDHDPIHKSHVAMVQKMFAETKTCFPRGVCAMIGGFLHEPFQTRHRQRAREFKDRSISLVEAATKETTNVAHVCRVASSTRRYARTKHTKIRDLVERLSDLTYKLLDNHRELKQGEVPVQCLFCNVYCAAPQSFGGSDGSVVCKDCWDDPLIFGDARFVRCANDDDDGPMEIYKADALTHQTLTKSRKVAETRAIPHPAFEYMALSETRGYWFEFGVIAHEIHAAAISFCRVHKLVSKQAP